MAKAKVKALRISGAEQDRRWLAGESVHRVVSRVFRGKQRNECECCPDFSCCKPELKASLAVRRSYMRSSRDVQETMLVGFLGAMLKAAGCQVVK